MSEVFTEEEYAKGASVGFQEGIKYMQKRRELLLDKKQVECQYCHKPYKEIVEAKNWDEMNVALDRDNCLHEWGNNGIGEKPTPINYCPMCNRKLGED